MHEQVVDINQTLLTHEDDAAYQEYLRKISALLPLKRRQYTRGNSFGVNSILPRMSLKTTGKRKWRTDTNIPGARQPIKKRKLPDQGTAPFFQKM